MFWIEILAHSLWKSIYVFMYVYTSVYYNGKNGTVNKLCQSICKCNFVCL